MTSPAKRRQTVTQVQQVLSVSERRACRVIGIPRSSQRYPPQVVEREASLTHRITELATEYGRYGYRRITTLLRGEGWGVNHKCVERIWRREGLKVPQIIQRTTYASFPLSVLNFKLFAIFYQSVNLPQEWAKHCFGL